MCRSKELNYNALGEDISSCNIFDQLTQGACDYDFNAGFATRGTAFTVSTVNQADQILDSLCADITDLADNAACTVFVNNLLLVRQFSGNVGELDQLDNNCFDQPTKFFLLNLLSR